VGAGAGKGAGTGTGAGAGAGTGAVPAVATGVKKEAVTAVAVAAPVEAAKGLRVPAAPATRRLARELGVDLQRVAATGPAGRVTKEDVIKAAKGGPVEVVEETSVMTRVWEGGGTLPLLDIAPLPDFSVYGPVEKEALRSIRRKTARRMMTSMTLIPHVAHMEDIDVTELEAFRAKLKSEGEKAPTLLAFVAKAITQSLKAYPAFNASLDAVGEEITYKLYYSIGIAVDTERGLVVPVVRNVDQQGLGQLAASIEDVATRARNGQLEALEFSGGTFTITNIGALGGTGFFPAINYPESAILGMGRTAEKPVVRDGNVVIRKILPVVLAFDHRIADGADAARFINIAKNLLENPLKLLLI